MVPVALLIAIIVFLYISLAFALYQLDKEQKKTGKLVEALNATRWVGESSLPAGAKVYWSRHTGSECLRCKKGKIARRYRFRVTGNHEGKVALRELRGIFWCDSCGYRGLSMTTSKGEQETHGRQEA